MVQGLLFLDLLHHPLFFAFAITLGGLAGLVVNFQLSRRFVFTPDARPVLHQFVTFALVAFSGLGLRLALAYALIALFALPLFAWIAALPLPAAAERVAHLAAVALVAVYSFLAHRHVTFSGGLLHRLAGRNVVVS